MTVYLFWLVNMQLIWGETSSQYLGFVKTPMVAYYKSSSLGSFLNCTIPVGVSAKIKDFDLNSNVYTLTFNQTINCEGAPIHNPTIVLPVQKEEENFFKVINNSNEYKEFRQSLIPRTEKTDRLVASNSITPEKPMATGRVTAKNGLNVRVGGESLGEIRSSSVITSLRFGEEVSLTGKKVGNWVQVQLPSGDLGWASKGVSGQLMEVVDVSSEINSNLESKSSATIGTVGSTSPATIRPKAREESSSKETSGGSAPLTSIRPSQRGSSESTDKKPSLSKEAYAGFLMSPSEAKYESTVSGTIVSCKIPVGSYGKLISQNNETGEAIVEFSNKNGKVQCGVNSGPNLRVSIKTPAGETAPFMTIENNDDVRAFRAKTRGSRDSKQATSQVSKGTGESEAGVTDEPIGTKVQATKLNEIELATYRPAVNNFLNMRTTPGTGGPILKRLFPTDRLVLLNETNGTWRKVKDIETGEDGWVSSNYLKKTSDTVKVSQLKKTSTRTSDGYSIGISVDDSDFTSKEKYELGTPIQPEEGESEVAQRLVTGMVAYMGAVYQSCEPIINTQKTPKSSASRSKGDENGRIVPSECSSTQRRRGTAYKRGGAAFKRGVVQTTSKTDCSATISGVMATRGMKLQATKNSPKRFTTAYSHDAYLNRKTSCMYNPKVSKNFSIQPGDILNTADNHQVMVYKAGPDPLGLNKVKSKSQCNNIDRTDFDFTIFHNSNRVYPHDGVRRNGPHFIEAKYLASKSITSLAAAVRKFCNENWPHLTGELSDKDSFGAKGYSKKPAYFSLQRHYGNRKEGCMTDKVTPLERGGCISEQCYSDARKDVFSESGSLIDWEGIKKGGTK